MNPTSDPTKRPTVTPVGRPTNYPTVPAGWIYLHHTAQDPHKYVGQTIRPPYKRINEERRTFPWGAELLPGRQGYTIVARVESEGDPVVDGVLLDLAEAVAIQRYHPTENINRPDPAVFHERLALARAGLYRPTPRVSRGVGPAAPTVGSRGRAVGRRSRGRGVSVGRLVLAALWGVFAFALCVQGGTVGAAWEVVPIAALLGPTVTVRLFRPGRRRRSRPYRRRRR